MKNLKKLFSLMAVVTLMVMTVAVVTSCSDDDNKDPEKVPTSAAMDFSFAVDKSLLEVVDVTIQYYKDGVVKTEVMNSDYWDDSLTKTSSKMPNTLGLKITMALKDGVTLDKEAYKVPEVVGKPSVFFFDQNGYEMSSKYKETNGIVSANISKDDFIEAVKNFKYEYVVKVNGYNQVEEVTNPTW